MSKSQPILITRAFSIVEAAFSTLLLGLLIAAALNTIGGTARARLSQASGQHGPTLARSLLTEVIQSHFEDPEYTFADAQADVNAGPYVFGPEDDEGTSDRSGFDDIDDYDDWSESPPRSKDGSTLDDYAGWTRTVTVRNVTFTTLMPAPDTNDTGIRQITVTIVSPDGRVTNLVSLRSRASTYDQAPAITTDYIAYYDIVLQVGPNASSRMTTGVNLLNRVPAPVSP